MNVKNVVGAFISTVLRIVIGVFILYELYKFVFIAYDFGYNVFADEPFALSPGMDVTVTITESMDNKAIAQEFEKDRLVKDWKLFYVQSMFSEYKKTITPGIYVLNNSMTAEQLMEAIGGAAEEDGEEGSKKKAATETDSNNVVINEAGTADESDDMNAADTQNEDDTTANEPLTNAGATN